MFLFFFPCFYVIRVCFGSLYLKYCSQHFNTFFLIICKWHMSQVQLNQSKPGAAKLLQMSKFRIQKDVSCTWIQTDHRTLWKRISYPSNSFFPAPQKMLTICSLIKSVPLLAAQPALCERTCTQVGVYWAPIMDLPLMLPLYHNMMWNHTQGPV